MIKVVKINDEKLNDLTKYYIFGKSAESVAYIFKENNIKKIFKCFIDKESISNKINKIHLMDERLPNSMGIPKAECLIEYNNCIIGYTMPYIEGKMFSDLHYSKAIVIRILKELSIKLKQLHELNIISADFPSNIIVNSSGEPHIIDYDNFKVDNLPIDKKNVLLKDYERYIKVIDNHFDDYLLNLFTLASINNIYLWYIKNSYKISPALYYFKDDEINKIVYNTFNLSKEYHEDLIIDKINSKKDFKKIRHRIF